MEKNGIKIKSDVLLIGGSSGSLDVVLKILASVKKDLSFAIVVVVHRKTTTDSTLADLLAIRSSLPVKEVEDKDIMLPGFVYLAPSDYHLLFEKKHFFSLDDSEKINYSRPSIDVTFESASEVYGAAVTAILLSGANADGSAGLEYIYQQGGTTIVQKPETATTPYMPQQAILHAHVDFQMDVEEMIALVNS